MKQIFTILLFFGLITNSFSQELNNQLIESALSRSYQRIVSLKSTEFGDDFDLLAIVNNKFTDKIKKYTSTFPKTLTAKFDSLRKHPNIYIVDSKDKQMRIYSWNTLMGGSRPYFANIFQYKVDSKVFSKVAYNQPYTLDGDYNDKNFQNFPFYSQIFTLEANNKTYYLGISNKIHSGQEVSQSIKIFTFDENKLNDSVALIKTQNGFVNTIDFNFNFFNLSDRPERPFQLIKYDSVKKIISIPTLDNNDNLSENFILYKFTGQHFELLETPKNEKINEIGIGFVTQKPLFVNAENGLIIRTSPNKKAERIGKFDYAEEIKLYRTTGKYFQIIDDGKKINGQWYEVTGFSLDEPNQTGYIFSGLLTSEILKKKINEVGIGFVAQRNSEVTAYGSNTLFHDSKLTKKWNGARLDAFVSIPKSDIHYFICLEKTDSYYKILVNDTDIAYVSTSKLDVVCQQDWGDGIVNETYDGSYDFKTWETVFSEAGVSRLNKDNPIVKDLNDQSQIIKYDCGYDTDYEHLSVNKMYRDENGEYWLNIKFNCEDSYPDFSTDDTKTKRGWIKWRKGNKLLIALSFQVGC